MTDPSNKTTSGHWLDLPGPGHIASSVKLVQEKRRGAPVNMTLSGKGRAWHSDGKYVWFRRKRANPATCDRLMGHIAKGELKHLTTSDDVEMYEVMPTSPFYRRDAQDLSKIEYASLPWVAVRAAKKRDWVAFVDTLTEFAGRIKGRIYSDGKPAEQGFANQVFHERLTYLFELIRASGGPSQDEIDREVQAVQSRRGSGRSAIVLPPASVVARA